MEVVFYTDGGARNMGDGEYARAGCAIACSEIDIERGFYLGDGISSNMAEYEAIIAAIKVTIDLGHNTLRIISDSELCVKHIQKEVLNWPGYTCSDPKLRWRLDIVKNLVKKLDYFRIEHTRRDNNKIADALVRSATKAEIKVPLPSSWEDNLWKELPHSTR